MQKFRRRRVHISWFIAWASAGVLAGVAAAPKLSSEFADTGWLVVAFVLFLTAVFWRAKPLIILALLAGLIIGAGRGAAQQDALGQYLPYYNQSVTLAGKVSEDTSYGPRGDQRIRLSQVRLGGQSLAGNVWVSTDSTAEIKRGDAVVLSGRLSEGFGNLPASIYKAQIIKIERPYPGDVGRRVRDWFAAGVYKAIPEPESSLGVGYVVGQKRALPEVLSEQMRIVGLTHAIVASGYNLMILIAFTRRLLSGTSKYLTVLSAGLLIVGFTLITGFSPSMTRAGLVAGLGLAAWYYGRTAHPLVLLPFAAAITVLLNPGYVWGDIGWYLSFAAFAGVIILAPLINHYFWGNGKRPGMLREILIATTAAQIATMPIIMFAFGQYSLYALPANLLVLPLVPFAMLATFVAGLAGVLVPGVAYLAGLPATVILKYTTWVVEQISSLPGAQGELSFSLAALAGSYLVMILLAIFMWRQTKHNFRKDQAV